MNYCHICGSRLVKKECINYGHNEGMIPFCPKCSEFRFPTFSTAVSAVIFNREYSKTLLIQQYGKGKNILVAGYVNKTENLEDALVREIKEEINLDVTDFYFNASEYFPNSNTLICNFITRVSNENFELTSEVDFASWYSIPEAKGAILKDSLAERFFVKALAKLDKIEAPDKSKVLCT